VIIIKIIVFILSLLSFNVLGCSFNRDFVDFIVSQEKHVEASKPNFTVASIHRGTDDGNGGSCSDAGIINLKIKGDFLKEQGYIFEIVQGVFEGNPFSKQAIFPDKLWHNKRLFRFIWFDGNSIKQEPFNIMVKIVAVSISGHKSEPQLLEIKHLGVKKESTWVEVQLTSP